jgi:hypothetical protein
MRSPAPTLKYRRISFLLRGLILILLVIAATRFLNHVNAEHPADTVVKQPIQTDSLSIQPIIALPKITKDNQPAATHWDGEIPTKTVTPAQKPAPTIDYENPPPRHPQ